MNIFTFKKLFLITVFFLSGANIFAAEIENSQEQSTIVENGTDKTSTTGNAKDWYLTETEWSKYQKLMQGSAGLWYSQLSPPAVLGMHADNPEDEKHFAEIYAKQEHQKVERELAFNKAAFKAIQRLYPDEPVIKPFDIKPFNPFSLSSQ